MRIMGHLPPVMFVKDLSLARLEEVEKLLQIADMGPDHEPASLGQEQKDEIELKYRSTGNEESENKSMRLSNISTLQKDAEPHIKTVHGKAHIESNDLEGEDNGNSIKEDTEDTIPIMNFRSDVYEIDHRSLLNKVMSSKHKLRDRSIDINTNYEDSILHKDTPMPSVLHSVNHSKELTKFLAKRRKGTRGRNAEGLSAYNLEWGLKEEDSGEYYDELEDYEDFDVDAK